MPLGIIQDCDHMQVVLAKHGCKLSIKFSLKMENLILNRKEIVNKISLFYGKF